MRTFFKIGWVLLAVLAASAASAVEMGSPGTNDKDRGAYGAAGYRAGEDWNDFAARQHWWGRGVIEMHSGDANSGEATGH